MTGRLASIPSIIEEARNGRMFILVDDEDRENEGDLIIPAQMATPDAINFMATHGRGLICLALTQGQAEQLRLPLMPRSNTTRFTTAFTTSIEAAQGVTTGISAPDRAHTIATAIREDARAEHITTPGHIFPLIARAGGVLVRAGHTEAAVDIPRLAGLKPSGVLCEIMDENGEMARLDRLVEFAQAFGLKIGSIADLIAYRLRHDRLVREVTRGRVHTDPGGDWEGRVFTSVVSYAEHLALIKGSIGGVMPVRMHALNLLDDVLCHETRLRQAMRIIEAEGRGVVIIIREPVPTRLSESIKGLEEGREASGADAPLRDYGIGAQILKALGVQEIELLTNHQRNIVGLSSYGLNIVRHRPIG